MSPCCALCVSLVLLTWLAVSTADVFTSSVKMVTLAASENSLLQAVSSGVAGDDRLKRLVAARRHVFQSQSPEEAASHPNGAYYMLKAFLTYWTEAISTDAALREVFETHRVQLPEQADLEGSLAGILRLQRVYSLRAPDMYAGNYSGFLGPALAPLDAHAIGQQAFTDGLLKESGDWLTLAVEKMGGVSRNAKPIITSNPDDNGIYSVTGKASVTGLLGRVYIYKGDKEEALRLYADGFMLEPSNGEVAALGKELNKPHPGAVKKRELIGEDLCRLCSRPKDQIVEQIKRFHVCRYKPSLFLPYLRYKEEILSLKPYASVFYDVITDRQIEIVKSRAMQLLRPANVEWKGAGPAGARSYVRNSDLAWLTDTSPEIVHLSAKVQDITWLKTINRHPLGPWAAESFQVVNYGIGGHYNAHLDILGTQKIAALRESGDRIATFLIYLEDVEKGGHTVFPLAGISVPPVKGTALFWYNVDSSFHVEPLTLHAGCPVIKGHKWVTNKWIWTYDNMFRSPCGPTLNSTHADTEHIAYSRRHSISLESVTQLNDEPASATS